MLPNIPISTTNNDESIWLFVEMSLSCFSGATSFSLETKEKSQFPFLIKRKLSECSCRPNPAIARVACDSWYSKDIRSPCIYYIARGLVYEKALLKEDRQRIWSFSVKKSKKRRFSALFRAVQAKWKRFFHTISTKSISNLY